MLSLSRTWVACVLLVLLPLGAAATPMVTTFAEYSVGPVTDTDGPQAGGALLSSVTTTNASQVCQFTGNCTGNGLAAAAQNVGPFLTAMGLVADGVFFSDPDNAESLTARTTWTASPDSDGPTDISLIVLPGRLAFADFNGLTSTDTPTIEARFRIELAVDGNPTPFFLAEAILRGGMSGGSSGHQLIENGEDLNATAFADPDFPNEVRGYDFDAVLRTISLGSLTTSDVVRYAMEVSVSGPGLETGGLARIGDPFDLSGDVSSIGFVPEPRLAALLVLGALALFWRRTAARS